MSLANDDLYEASALPFLRINQPRSGQTHLVGDDPHVVDVRVYNWPPSMWGDAYICVEIVFTASSEVGNAESYQGCFGTGTGVLSTWPESSFRFHAKLELFYDYQSAGRYAVSAHLVVSSSPPQCALGSMMAAGRPLGEVLAGATLVSSHAFESFAIDAPPLPQGFSGASSAPTAVSLRVQSGFASSHWLARHVVRSLAAAGEGRSLLGVPELNVTGMIGAHTRLFLNALAGGMAAARQAARGASCPGSSSVADGEDGSEDGCSVLEVGVYMGASLCAAVSGNAGVRYLGIDHWSQFGGQREALANARNCPPMVGAAPVTLVDGDCWAAAAALRKHARLLQGALSGGRGGEDTGVGGNDGGDGGIVPGVTGVVSLTFPVEAADPEVVAAAVLGRSVAERHAPVDIYHFDGALQLGCV